MIYNLCNQCILIRIRTKKMEELIGSLYAPVFKSLVLILCLIKTLHIYKDERQLMWVLTFLLIIAIGNRPLTIHFIDTMGYAYAYNEVYKYLSFKDCLQDKDYIFSLLMYLFRNAGLSVHVFFTFVASVYIGLTAWTAQRLSKRYAYLIFLCLIGTFSFYAFSINTIRCGMAAVMVLLAFTFIENKKIVSIALCWCAVGIHNSVMLPIVCIVVSYFCKNTKIYLWIWLACIVISNIDHHSVESFLMNLGWVEDDRFSQYILNSDNKEGFSYAGFRWDFLLYSAVPIVVAYYFIVKKNFQDKLYLLFANTYILANSFWILVIYASFSDRFAYLSWFLYGIVLVYPFLAYPKLLQRRKLISLVLLGNALFTWVMWLIGK